MVEDNGADTGADLGSGPGADLGSGPGADLGAALGARCAAIQRVGRSVQYVKTKHVACTE